MADFTAEERRELARQGVAMSDGSFPVRNAADLSNAIQSVGRAGNSQPAVRKHIIGRAKALGLMPNIPDSWSSDGAMIEKDDAAFTVPIWKDDTQHLVFGVVLTPGVEDSQGDICSPEEIEKAAHEWLTTFRKHDVQHSGEEADIVPVESFIAPADFQAAGQTVLKGSWVLGARVNDAETWRRVEKQELTGFSIEGLGVREPVVVAI